MYVHECNIENRILMTRIILIFHFLDGKPVVLTQTSSSRRNVKILKIDIKLTSQKEENSLIE